MLLATGKVGFINAAALVSALFSLILGFQGAVAFKFSRFSAHD